jgi:hypothetical protein
MQVAQQTWGMRLDAALESLAHLSSPQLYALIVGATMCVSLALLGSPHPLPSLKASVDKVKRQPSGPQPKWHIFKWVNTAIVGCFAASVLEFTWHASEYWQDMWKFCLGWSVFLCYFFGFFGVSFVHEAMMEETDSQVSEEMNETVR